jgi:hypothetical protein
MLFKLAEEHKRSRVYRYRCLCRGARGVRTVNISFGRIKRNKRIGHGTSAVYRIYILCSKSRSLHGSRRLDKRNDRAVKYEKSLFAYFVRAGLLVTRGPPNLLPDRCGGAVVRRRYSMPRTDTRRVL